MIALLMASRSRKKLPPQHFFKDAYDLLRMAGGFSWDAQVREWADEYDAMHKDDHGVSSREAMKRLGYAKSESFWAAVERTFGEQKARRFKTDITFSIEDIAEIEAQRREGKEVRAACARYARSQKKS